MKYVAKDQLVTGGDSSAKCSLCGLTFASPHTTIIQCHYERILKNVQKRKRDPEPFPEPPAKRFKVICEEFSGPEDYLRTCEEHTAVNHLSLAYWDSETTRRFQAGFEKAFNVSVAGRKVAERINMEQELDVEEAYSDDSFDWDIIPNTQPKSACTGMCGTGCTSFTVSSQTVSVTDSVL